jgi:hypothetical protein
VAPPQSPSPEQARQVCVTKLQTGVVPEQSALAVQRTQLPVTTSHTGVAPEQAVGFVAEHWPHAPEG